MGERKVQEGFSVGAPDDDAVLVLVLEVGVASVVVLNVPSGEVKLCTPDDQRPDDRLESIVTVMKVVLKTVDGVTQIVSTKIGDCDDLGNSNGGARPGWRAMSHGVGGGLGGASSENGVIKSAVTVLVLVTVWFSVLHSQEACETRAGLS